MYDAKYIVFEDRSGGDAVVLIFSPTLVHADMAKAVRYKEPVGAGFIRITDDGVRAYGTSYSLNVASRPEKDTMIIAQHLNLRGD